MRTRFIHQNIPGQFRYLIAALLEDGANEVWAIGAHSAAERCLKLHPRLKLVTYELPAAPGSGAHPWLADVEGQVRRGQVVTGALLQLKGKGLAFDVIVAHPGWGEAMFVKDVYPATPLLTYFEFYYSAAGADVGFDPELPARPDDAPRLRVRNSMHLSALHACDAGIAPTHWQRSRLPAEYRDRIRVVHEGVDTDAVRPTPGRGSKGRGARSPPAIRSSPTSRATSSPIAASMSWPWRCSTRLCGLAAPEPPPSASAQVRRRCGSSRVSEPFTRVAGSAIIVARP